MVKGRMYLSGWHGGASNWDISLVLVFVVCLHKLMAHACTHTHHIDNCGWANEILWLLLESYGDLAKYVQGWTWQWLICGSLAFSFYCFYTPLGTRGFLEL